MCFRTIVKCVVTMCAFIVLVACKTSSPENQEYQKLISEKKYLTAMEYLEKLDSKNENPVIVTNKFNLALNYYAQCLGGIMFAFRDLKPEEDIATVRGSVGAFSMFQLDGAKILPALLKKYPNDGRLHKAAGDYFYFYSYNCGQTNKYLNESLQNYLIAERNDAFDANTLGKIGELLVTLSNDYEKATSYLEKSVKLDPQNAKNNYNLSVCYMKRKQFSDAAKHAVIAYTNYKNTDYKIDAAINAMWAYTDAKDIRKANEMAKNVYLYKGSEPDIFTYNNLKELLTFYIETNQSDDISQIMDDFFALDPTNPKLTQDILAKIEKHGDKSVFIQFVTRNINKYTENPEAIGNLYFHLGFFYMSQKNNEDAKKAFLKAKQSFSKLLKRNHQVFKEINRALKTISDESEKPNNQ